jgi:hypothetical protein
MGNAPRLCNLVILHISARARASTVYEWFVHEEGMAEKFKSKVGGFYSVVYKFYCLCLDIGAFDSVTYTANRKLIGQSRHNPIESNRYVLEMMASLSVFLFCCKY